MVEEAKRLCGVNTCINIAVENRIYCKDHELGPDKMRTLRFGVLKRCLNRWCKTWFRSKDSDYCPEHR